MGFNDLGRDGYLPAITSSGPLQVAAAGASPAMLSAPGGANNPLNLESGAVWANDKTGVVLQYMFWNTLPTYYSGASAESNNFQAFSASMKAGAVDVLNQISTFANITFSQTTNEAAAQLGYAQAQIDPNAGAWAYYPSSFPKGGDIWTNNLYSNTQNVAKGTYGFYTLLHETGHALGLEHTFEVGLTGAYNTEQYSVMAYDWSPWSGVFAQSFMLFDIAALQDMYGANMTYHTGNDTYALQNGAAYTIWDAGGTDTLDASALGLGVTIKLEAGTFSSVGLTENIAIAYNVTIENANGSESADSIYGNEVANILNGNGGNDTFYTDAGNDTISGGNGTDTVVYTTNLANFLVSFVNSVTVTIKDLIGSLGTDTLSYVENFMFGGITYNRPALESAVGGGGGGTTITPMNISMLWSGGTAKIASTAEGSSMLTAAGIKYAGKTGNLISTSRTANDMTMNFLQNITLTNLKFDGGAESESLTLSGTAAITARLTGGAGNDVFTIAATITGADIIYGGAGDDTVYASAGSDKLYGDSGNDVLYGEIGDDTLYGGDGNDNLTGGDGLDKLYGEAGNDILDSGAGNDVLDGGAGNDTFIAAAGIDKIYGGDGDDTANAGDGNDIVYGDAGNDVLDGGAGDDKIYGGLGNDTLKGGLGIDTIYGEAGNDDLVGGDGNDKLYGDAGNDAIDAGAGDDIVDGGEGDDTLNGVAGIDKIYGGNGLDMLIGGDGNDLLSGDAGNDIVYGDAGDDKVYGGLGNDTLSGGLGLDIVYGEAGNDTLNGNDGNDKLYGDAGLDVMDGGAGDDIVDGGLDNDTLSGGAGLDKVYGGAGNDIINGGGDADLLYGDAGDDRLDGGAGNDKVYGGVGNDKLTGGGGTDLLYGEAGSDTFGFMVLGGGSYATVSDFTLAGTSKDYINVTDVLSGFDKGIDNINDFVKFTAVGSSLEVLINADGAGGDWTAAGKLMGSTFTNVTVNSLFASGQLIADVPL